MKAFSYNLGWKYPLFTQYSYGGDPIDIKTGTITETQIGPEFIIPAGMMGIHDELYIEAIATITSSANMKTLSARIGAVGAAFSGALITSANVNTSGQVGHTLLFALRNMGKLNKQRFSNLTFGGTAVGNPTVDFSLARAICFTATIPTASEVLKLESVLIQIQRGGV